MIVIKSYSELGRMPVAGDRVKIKDFPGFMHWNDRMNKFLSTIMTVRKYDEYDECLKMKEDFGDFHENAEPGWNWYMDAIEGVVIETHEDIAEDISLWSADASLEVLLT